MKIFLNNEKRVIGILNVGEHPEAIEVKKLPPEPYINYKYINGKYVYDKYLEDLVEIKKLKIEELKTIRDKKISEDLEVDGALFQVRAGDLQKFFLKKIENDLIPDVNRKETWRLADNTYKEITFEDIEKILKAYGNRERESFYKFGVLEAQVMACETVEEIEAIEWL